MFDLTCFVCWVWVCPVRARIVSKAKASSCSLLETAEQTDCIAGFKVPCVFASVTRL